MAITLTTAFLNELKKNVNQPNVILEVALDSGAVKWGFATGGFSDVKPILKSVSSLQNKIDPKAGYTTRGQLTFVITGRDNFKTLIQNEYLKNRRITRKDGFIASGFVYSDYAATFTGKVLDWSRKGDELTVTIGDEMLINASKNLPVENASKTQYIDYRNTSPADIMTNMLITQLGISSGYVDSAKFTSERDNWMLGWKFDRVLTEPKRADDYLNELQVETNSYLIHDGEKVSLKVNAPPVPGQNIEEWTDANHILRDTFAMKSGYKDQFFNRIVFYYDYDESGDDKEENFESAAITLDAASQGSSQWNETTTKTIKSKWIRTRTYTQPVNITGAVIYHVSRGNGATGTGYLTYTAASKTLQWTPPGGVVGAAEPVTSDGKYQVFGADTTKYARVIVTVASLPVGNQNDAIPITAIAGDVIANTVSQKLLSRYRDPAASVSFEVDLNNAAWNSAFIKPTDIKDLTTDEAFGKGYSGWSKNRMMLTSVRADFEKHKVSIEAVETKFYRRYGFIAPAGLPDYTSATDAQKEYGYIRDASPQYFIW